MNTPSAVGSLIADRTISTKVGVGFACVLALLAIVSTTSYLSFQSAETGFTTYAQRVSVVGTAREIERGFLNLRRYVREFALLGTESNVEAANKEQAVLQPLFQQGLAEIKNPERHRQLDDAARNFEVYWKDFGQLVAQRREQTKLMRGTLDPTGASLLQHFETLIAAAAKAGDGNVAVLGNEGLKQLMLARLYANKFLGENEESANSTAQKAFTDLASVLQSLDAATKGAEFRKTFDEMQNGATTYREAFRKTSDLEAAINDMINKTMAPNAQQIQVNTEAIKASGMAEEKQEERDTLSTMASTSSLILYLSIGGLVFGAVLAWLIGRGIARPVVGMCAAMRALAGGDKTVEVPGIGRKDEIGQMADTVAVFKRNLIEADRLREETERRKAEAEAERKTGLLRLADNFEAGIKGVVNSVASQATEMQSSAQAMTHTAEQATNQATAVAASVEEASANVQTVASSAEELSSSVLEIGRQVEQSSKIASEAVIEADKTNSTVEGLNKTAQRIGEVVQLIETIAGQTNLLPAYLSIQRNISRLADSHAGFTRAIPIIL